MTLQSLQAERVHYLDNKVKFLEEENQLMKELLIQRRSHPDVTPEEEEKSSEPGISIQVICGTRVSTKYATNGCTSIPHLIKSIHGSL
jgi:hypothetical protein